jgi:hypothetical protein
MNDPTISDKLGDLIMVLNINLKEDLKQKEYIFQLLRDLHSDLRELNSILREIANK